MPEKKTLRQQYEDSKVISPPDEKPLAAPKSQVATPVQNYNPEQIIHNHSPEQIIRELRDQNFSLKKKLQVQQTATVLNNWLGKQVVLLLSNNEKLTGTLSKVDGAALKLKDGPVVQRSHCIWIDLTDRENKEL
jgi:hypothetical protein